MNSSAKPERLLQEVLLRLDVADRLDDERAGEGDRHRARRSAARPAGGWACRPASARPRRPDLLTDAATRSLATATVGLTPRKISAGVIRAPPPMPVRPTTMPTPKLTSSTDSALVVRRSVTMHLPWGSARPGRGQVAGVVQAVEHVVEGSPRWCGRWCRPARRRPRAPRRARRCR